MAPHGGSLQPRRSKCRSGSLGPPASSKCLHPPPSSCDEAPPSAKSGIRPALLPRPPDAHGSTPLVRSAHEASPGCDPRRRRRPRRPPRVRLPRLRAFPLRSNACAAQRGDPGGIPAPAAPGPAPGRRCGGRRGARGRQPERGARRAGWRDPHAGAEPTDAYAYTFGLEGLRCPDADADAHASPRGRRGHRRLPKPDGHAHTHAIALTDRYAHPDTDADADPVSHADPDADANPDYPQ